MINYKKKYYTLIYNSLFLIDYVIAMPSYISIHITTIFNRKRFAIDFGNEQYHTAHFLMSRQRKY